MIQQLTDDSFAGAVYVCMQNPDYFVGVCFHRDSDVALFEQRVKDNFDQYDIPSGTIITCDTVGSLPGVYQRVVMIILPNRNKICLCSGSGALLGGLRFNAVLYDYRVGDNMQYKLRTRSLLPYRPVCGLGKYGKFVKPIDWTKIDNPELDAFLEELANNNVNKTGLS